MFSGAETRTDYNSSWIMTQTSPQRENEASSENCTVYNVHKISQILG